jgi:predicted GTPase
MNNQSSIFKTMEHEISNSFYNELTKAKLLFNLSLLKKTKLNIMVVGGTGSGKSSTINALFNMDIATVGIGCDPETMGITHYQLNNLVIWDTPGLGDSSSNDRKHATNIELKLNEQDDRGNLLVDLVLVVIDGSTRDMGSSNKLINEVIIPNLGANPEKRLLVAINQADIAMRGNKAWDHQSNKPTPESASFLDEKVLSVKKRVKESTGIDIEPIYYAAGFKEKGIKQIPYNLSKLLFLIVSNIPTDKRIVLADRTLSAESTTWRDDDEQRDYRSDTQKTLWESITASATAGADIGGDIGSIFGNTGEHIGRLLGGTIGAIGGGILGFFGF